MTDPLFCSMDSAEIASDIREALLGLLCGARHPARACKSMSGACSADRSRTHHGLPRIRRTSDALGFGELAAVKTLHNAGIVVNSTQGLRTGLVIVDHRGYIFTPTALYLETEDRTAEAPNAMRLSKEQVMEALARLSPAAKAIAIALATTEEERQRIKAQAVEVPSTKVVNEKFAAVGSDWRKPPGTVRHRAPGARFQRLSPVRRIEAHGCCNPAPWPSDPAKHSEAGRQRGS